MSAESVPIGVPVSIQERLAAPSLLLFLLIFGGATSGSFVANGAVQVVSAGAIILCLLDRQAHVERRGVVLICIALVAVLVCVAQLIPLPPDIWSSLPGRGDVSEAFAASSIAQPWLPLTLSPSESIFGLAKLLPPLAAVAIFARSLPGSIGSVLAWSIVLFAACSVLFGVAQVVSGGKPGLYLHAFTNHGLAVGFMANANHQATLLLMSIPFGVALLASSIERAQEEGDGIGRHIAIGAFCCIPILGIALTESLAGLVFLPIALGLSLLGSFNRKLGRITVFGLFAGVTSVGVAVAIVITSPVMSSLGFPEWAASEASRRDTYERTIEIVADTFPAGSGVGSFEWIYPRHEDAAAVTNVYMNHAHSDVLEVVLELGLAGVVLMLAVVGWYFVIAHRIWRANGGVGTRLRRAASVAFLVALLHSFIDYPMRTAAIAGFAAACLGIMASPSVRRPAPGAASEAETSFAEMPRGRHVVI